MRTSRLWSGGVCALAVAALADSGCTMGAVGPTPFTARESAQTVGRNRHRVDIAGGGGVAGCCGWGGAGGGGTLRIRGGVAKNHELGVSGYVLRIHDEAPGQAYPKHLFFGAKLDYKWRLHPNLALLLGAGGGLSPRAPWVGGDIGFIVSRSRRVRVEPFGLFRFSFSLPVGRFERFTPGRDDDHGGTTESFYLIAGGGMLVNASDHFAFVLEGGFVAILLNASEGHGYGGYGVIGFNLRL